VEPWEDADADNETLIMGALFEIKARLIEVEEHVVAIRTLLEDEDEDEEEEENGAEP